MNAHLILGRCQKSPRAPRQLGGFTLVELLVVITVIGIMIGLLLPAVQAAREAARRMQCTNNLRQIALALHNYHSQRNVLPYGAPDYGDRNGGTWAAMILPFMDLENHYSLFNFNTKMNDSANTTAVTTVVAAYICPSDPAGSKPIMNRLSNDGSPGSPAYAHGMWYGACMGPTEDYNGATGTGCKYCPSQTASATNWCCQGFGFGTNGTAVGMFGRGWENRIAFGDVTDGLSNTIMIGETLPAYSPLFSVFAPTHCVVGTNIPINVPAGLAIDYTQEPASTFANADFLSVDGFKSFHAGGACFALGDGSVHFFSETINFQLFNNLGTRAGGEIATVPD